MNRLWNVLLSWLHLKKVKGFKYEKDATWEKFIMSCKACRRHNEYVATIILTSDISPTMLSKGTRSATGSPVSHVGTMLDDCYTIIESQFRVTKASIIKYRREDLQLIAYSVSLNKINYDRLVSQLKSQIGKLYDVAEFARHLQGIFKKLPNDKNDEINDKRICSTLTTFGWKFVFHKWMGRWSKLRLVNLKIDPNDCSPADIYESLKSQYRFRESRYHC